MIKKIPPSILGLGLILLGNKANAQLNYTVSYPAITYTALPTSAFHPPMTIAFPLSVATAQGYTAYDEGAANNLALPFPFTFNGAVYNTYHINSNGFIALGSLALDTLDGFWANNLTSGPFNGATNNSRASRPIIAPLWDDLDFQAAANISTATTGTTPNRILTIQWSNVLWDWKATASVINFQIKLYEVDNSILFHYRPINTGTVATGSGGASVGLADGDIGTGNFLSLSGLKSTANISSSFEHDTIKLKPAANFAVKFTPTPIPSVDAGISNITAPSVYVTCFDAPKPVQITLTNTGTTTIAPGAASINLKSFGANSNDVTATNTTSIPFKGTEIITLNLNLSNPTIVSDSIIGLLTLTGDTRLVNDTVRRFSSTGDTYSGGFPLNDGGNVNAIKWRRNIFGGNNGWTVRGTSYLNSALGDSLTANSGKDFYMFNPVASALVSNSILYTNCMVLPAGLPASSYQVKFNMSHDSSRPAVVTDTDSDSMFVIVSNDKGLTWNRIGGFSRIISGIDLPTYQADSVAIDTYAGQTIQIGFEGVGYYGNVFGLDDIEVSANYPLPITLSSFSGYKEATKNILNWQTANEVNNKGFELERSIDGKEFTKIAVINSKATNGNSTGANEYSYTDEKYFGATNYYRLRQLDKDGKSTLSKVVVIKSAQITKAQISRIFPNPVQEKLNVVLNTPTSEKVTIAITDLVGKTITQKFVETTLGDNNIQFNTVQLAKGTYVIKVYSNTNTEIATQKFVK